jgi:hypothetical protein
MLMTTGKLLVLRIYTVTVGRWALFSKILRKLLVRVLITDKQEKYVPSSKYFDPKEMG